MIQSILDSLDVDASSHLSASGEANYSTMAILQVLQNLCRNSKSILDKYEFLAEFLILKRNTVSHYSLSKILNDKANLLVYSIDTSEQ